MGAALTIALLLALSVSCVRIAAVAMRLTGLPDTVARFQCVSALTGTGFTTGEAEMIVNYPIRRRIVVTLMVLGNLGLVSIASTFIVAFVNAGSSDGSILVQAMVLIVAIGLTFLVVTNQTLDRFMCALIGRILIRMTGLGTGGFHRLLQLSNNLSVAEHKYHGSANCLLVDLDLQGANLLAVRQTGSTHASSGTETIHPGDTLIVCAPDNVHRSLSL